MAIPPYARLLRGDLMIEYGLARLAVYETPCFWSGETTFAGHEAVLSTEAGWVGGEEVVRVFYDPKQTDLNALDRFAQTEGFRRSSGRSFRPDQQPQYYVAKSVFARLPLSPAQRTRINRSIPYRDRPEQFLSSRQRMWLADSGLGLAGDGATYKTDIRRTWKQFC